MNPITWIHIAGGSAALILGALAVSARKGGLLHARAGQGFATAMIVLGASAAILYWMKEESGVGGLVICYFVATSWVAARRRDGTTGKFEILACASAFLLAALMVYGAVAGTSKTPVGSGPIFAFAGVFLLAAILDLNVILRARITAAQRIARHLWRMCFAFFFATGSFFLGQQDVMPATVRGSPILFLLAFAPFAVMLFFLVRLRFGKALRTTFEAIGSTSRGPGAAPGTSGVLAGAEAAE